MRVGTLTYPYFLNLYIPTNFLKKNFRWACAHPGHALDPPVVAGWVFVGFCWGFDLQWVQEVCGVGCCGGCELMFHPVGIWWVSGCGFFLQ